MSAIRFLAADKLASWLAEVAASRQVLAPRQEGKAVVFRPLVAGETPSLARATVSPKAAVFPACETLVHFTGTKDPENPAKLNMKLDDTPDAPARMVFGCRSCDARGFAVLDKPFLEGKFQDAYYKARRDNLLVVTRTCDSPCSTCFCHWTGGGPADPTGSDVLLTAVNGGFVLEAVSEKGEAFLASTKLADGSDKMDEAKAAREKAAASQQPAPDLSKAARRLEQRFTDVDFWAEQTAKCLSCGACTYMCPTCQCFNISDEGDPLEGRRLRSWDNCMSSLFTREASGHNPRMLKAFRMRNRVSHKFSTYPENWGAFSCNGCGRCISNCPVCLDIRAIVLAALNADQATAE